MVEINSDNIGLLWRRCTLKMMGKGENWRKKERRAQCKSQIKLILIGVGKLCWNRCCCCRSFAPYIAGVVSNDRHRPYFNCIYVLCGQIEWYTSGRLFKKAFNAMCKASLDSLLQKRDCDTRICSKIVILNKTFISSLCLIIFGFFLFSSAFRAFFASFIALLVVLFSLLLNMTFDILSWPLQCGPQHHSHIGVMCVFGILLFISHLLSLLLLLLLVAI